MKTRILFFLCCLTSLLFGEWSNDPNENLLISTLENEQVIPKISKNMDGSFYIAYFTNFAGLYRPYLQYLDSDGNILWNTDGLEISAHESMTWLTDWEMISDHENNAILAFQDIRNGTNDIFVYKISSTGEFLWGDDGIQLSQEGFNAAPKIAVTTNNNIIVTWSSDAKSTIQGIDPEGNLLFGNNGIDIIDTSMTVAYSWPQVIAVEDDCFIVKYFEDSGPAWAPTRKIYAQKYDSSGSELWAEPANIQTLGGLTAWTQILPIVKDNANGFYIAWHDDRDSDNDTEAFLQHIASDGSVSFVDGLDLSTADSYLNFQSCLAYDNINDALYAVWSTTDMGQNMRGIFGQKIQDDEIQWSSSGVNLIPLENGSTMPLGLHYHNDEILLTYERSDNINAMKFDISGNTTWEQPVIMKSQPSSVIHPDLTITEENQIVVAWENEGSNTAIYAQNVNWNGTIGVIEPVSGIQGTITLSNSEFNIENAAVSLNGEVFTVSENGTYYIEYEPGSFDIIVSHPNYTPLTSNVEILAGDIITMDFHLENEVSNEVIASTKFLQVYPNPFRSDQQRSKTQSISFYNAKDQNVKVSVYNAKGQLVSIIANQAFAKGKQTLFWNGKNNTGDTVSTGIYLLQLRSETNTNVRKTTIIK